VTKNRLLKSRTAQDIDGRIDRVLRGLGNPEPPLRLTEVRELLKLDRVFYTAADPTLLREAVSRIRVATIQVALRPMLLLDAIKKWSLEALYLPDRKRILLDSSLPEKKHRWSEAHEIGHSLIPWHDDVMHGDNRHTLLPDCREQIEAEANFAAGRLLFLRDRFTTQARDYPLTIASVQELHGDFGNTFSSTLWRFVETLGTERPIIGMISCHPHANRRPTDFDPAQPCRHFIQSPAFIARFARLTEIDLFRTVASYCGAQSGGPLGAAELILTDDNGDEHVFAFETFFIRYKPPAAGEALTLGTYLRPNIRTIAVS
jgi:hypothetical protein